MKAHVCKDCKADPVAKTPRPAPHPGPRCDRHHRLRKRAVRLANRERVAVKQFGMQPGERTELAAFQDGKCAICGTGLDYDEAYYRWRQTAHDHDHGCCPGKTSCGQCVRGLVCMPCNTEVLPRLDLAGARRLVAYYEDPPLARLRRAKASQPLEDAS